MSVWSVGSAGIEGLQKSFAIECGQCWSDFKGLQDILNSGIAADVLSGCAQGLQYEDRKQERNLSSAGTQGP
jgi:hypothetical protein